MAEIKYEIVERIAVLGTRMGKGISLSHDELAILKGILEDMEL